MSSDLENQLVDPDGYSNRTSDPYTFNKIHCNYLPCLHAISKHKQAKKYIMHCRSYLMRNLSPPFCSLFRQSSSQNVMRDVNQTDKYEKAYILVLRELKYYFPFFIFSQVVQAVVTFPIRWL